MKLFELEIVLPEREFYRGQVEAVDFQSPDGQVGVLADHAPMVAPLLISNFRFKEGGAWRSIFIAEGFLKVSADGVSVFATAAEWPEDIDVPRAKRAKERAEDVLRNAPTAAQKAHFEQSLRRADMRLKIAGIR